MFDHAHIVFRESSSEPGEDGYGWLPAANDAARSIVAHLGLSLGKINFLVKAMIEKGFVKAENFTAMSG